MSTAHITIDPDGTNNLSLDGSPAAPVRGTGKTAQNAAMEQIRAHAARTQQTVALHVQDTDDSTFDLRIAPDGQVWTAPPTQTEPASVPDSMPTWEQDDTPITVPRVDQTPPPTATEVPDAPDNSSPDLKATHPRHATARSEQPEPGPVRASLAPFAPSPADLSAAPQHNADPQPEAQLMDAEDIFGPPAHAPDHIPDPVGADPRWAKISQQPASQGFRGTLNGMGLKLTPGPEELNARRETLRQDIAREEQERLAEEEHSRTVAAQEGRRAAREREAAERDKADRAVIQTSYEEPQTVTIANEKGGVGKTTAEFCLAATFGRIRGGDVVAWDANETRGTLGFRAQKAHHTRSVVDLLEEAADDFTTVQGSKRSTLMRYTRNQGDNLFGVIASDESRDRQDLVDGDAFAKVHEILARFYSLILIDTGNNHRVNHFTAALAATDQLVIPVSAGADGAYAAEAMMDNFIGLGYGDLVKNAVVLLNDSPTRPGDATGIAAKFDNRVRAIIPIPFDPALDSGDQIIFDDLKPATRAAWQKAAASIAQGLADTDRKDN